MILTEDDLVRWGNRIGQEVGGPLFLGLKGPLGAGKSVLARAVARGAGVEGPIPSPTFNLLFHYQSVRGIPIVHMDLYRIEGAEELWELGWEDLGSSAEIALVEWPERAGSLLPKDRWEIELVVPERGSDLRKVAVSRFGKPLHLPGFPVRLGDEGGEGEMI
ncbi:MAG: tRNA (adenosine(37)-N6)-threonylcarbamoyltransferase complex ATPase subunit type 1 TsaE [Longimicrobiales bacterium]|nr:tRNA (adenosine(37)-N6)-threonylcarbamoyltransferase complex ATPase subunit type 1 TsaE [Longimicrobiales bacterium]